MKNLLFLIFSCLPIFTFAQISLSPNVEVMESQALKPLEPLEKHFVYKDGYVLAAKRDGAHLYIQKFKQDDLSLVFNVKHEKVFKNSTEFLIKMGEHIYLMTSSSTDKTPYKRLREQTDMSYVKIDFETGQLKNEKAFIFENSDKEKWKKKDHLGLSGGFLFLKEKYEDRVHFLYPNDGKLGIKTHNSALEVINERSITWPADNDDKYLIIENKIIDSKVMDNGTVLFFFKKTKCVAYFKKCDIETYILIARPNDSEFKKILVNTPSFSIRNIGFITLSDGSLGLGGMYLDDNIKSTSFEISGFLFAKLTDDKLVILGKNAISPNMILNYEGKANAVSNLEPTHIVADSKGGIIVIGEVRSSIVGSIFMMAFDKAGKMIWQKKIAKKQIPGRVASDGSFQFIWNEDGNFYLLYFDKIENKGLPIDKTPQAYYHQKKGHLIIAKVNVSTGDINKTYVFDRTDVNGHTLHNVAMSNFTETVPDAFIFEAHNNRGSDFLYSVTIN